MTKSALDQRLRRACQVKKNGKCPGGADAHELYKKDEEGVRDMLGQLLLLAGFDKAGIGNSILMPLQTCDKLMRIVHDSIVFLVYP